MANGASLIILVSTQFSRLLGIFLSIARHLFRKASNDHIKSN
ncbi:hypothetical protein PORCAN_1311 [Porphyromonas crevioricanis JCM 13913]|nr:hypothetical protein PORCAN_1311 [Porphyromonas crevioricanis JCM 13913]